MTPAETLTIFSIMAHVVVGYLIFALTGLLTLPVWASACLAGLWIGTAVLIWCSARDNAWLALALLAMNAFLAWAMVASGCTWGSWCTRVQ